MLDNILLPLINWIESVVTAMGPAGVALLMAIESCNIPLPSEAILPFAGYLVSKGEMGFHTASFAGAIGCVLGSLPSYYIGYFGGRTFVEKYGRYFLVSKKDLEEADKWVEKYGDWAFFICRMLPVVRTFISLPAGILKAKKRTFFTFTFLGSLIWSYLLVYVGVKLGQNMDKMKEIWHKFDVVIVLACAILFGLYIWKHFKHIKDDINNESKTSDRTKLKALYPYDVTDVELDNDKVVINGYEANILTRFDENTYKISVNGVEVGFVHNGKECALAPFGDAQMFHHNHHLGLWKIPKFNALFAEVSKNACSTVVSEIYNNFYSNGVDKYTPDGEWIWDVLPKEERYEMNLPLEAFLEGEKDQYKTIFLVYDDPVKRFIRALNNKYIDQHSILSKLKPPYEQDIEHYIDQVILLTRLNLLNEYAWDQHIVPITTYHKDILPYVTDIVWLEDIDKFLLEKFGIKTAGRYYKSKKHLITVDCLTASQRAEIEKIYQADYQIPKIYSEKFY